MAVFIQDAPQTLSVVFILCRFTLLLVLPEVVRHARQPQSRQFFLLHGKRNGKDSQQLPEKEGPETPGAPCRIAETFEASTRPFPPSAGKPSRQLGSRGKYNQWLQRTGRAPKE
jgi:hypothetical protein